jgi:hypothetical protein
MRRKENQRQKEWQEEWRRHALEGSKSRTKTKDAQQLGVFVIDAQKILLCVDISCLRFHQ